jgi:hypothetical protein
VKSLLFIIVVIVYLQYLEERSGKKKRSLLPHTLFASQTASHYSLAIISAIFLDVRLSIAKVGSS